MKSIKEEIAGTLLWRRASAPLKFIAFPTQFWTISFRQFEVDTWEHLNVAKKTHNTARVSFFLHLDPGIKNRFSDVRSSWRFAAKSPAIWPVLHTKPCLWLPGQQMRCQSSTDQNLVVWARLNGDTIECPSLAGTPKSLRATRRVHEWICQNRTTIKSRFFYVNSLTFCAPSLCLFHPFCLGPPLGGISCFAQASFCPQNWGNCWEASKVFYYNSFSY